MFYCTNIIFIMQFKIYIVVCDCPKIVLAFYILNARVFPKCACKKYETQNV